MKNIIDFISENSTFIETFCTILLVIPVLSLIWDKISSQKPKITVNFELIRSSLACIVIHNYGNVAAELKSLIFNEEFLIELDKRLAKKLLSMKETKIYLAPGQKWIINFETNIFNIINDFENKECKLKFTFSKPLKKFRYKGANNIKFDDYSYFTLYTSELDELNNTLNKIHEELSKISQDKKLTDVETKICTEISDLKDEFIKQIKSK